ncbi:MAG: hypothetical protein AABZ06_06335 [Bdellovibrionota bacterium]
MKKLYLVSLVVLVFVSTVSAQNANSMDIRATNCEVFIDKVGVYHAFNPQWGEAIAAQFYVKTINDRLDGKVKKVGFYAQTRHAKTGGVMIDWREFTSFPFEGATDYFEFFLKDFRTDATWTFPHEFEGAFFVETENGTRYWANTSVGGNFVINPDLVKRIEQATGRQYGDKHGGNFKVRQLPKTADFFQELNPWQCR